MAIFLLLNNEANIFLLARSKVALHVENNIPFSRNMLRLQNLLKKHLMSSILLFNEANQCAYVNLGITFVVIFIPED